MKRNKAVIEQNVRKAFNEDKMIFAEVRSNYYYAIIFINTIWQKIVTSYGSKSGQADPMDNVCFYKDDPESESDAGISKGIGVNTN